MLGLAVVAIGTAVPMITRYSFMQLAILALAVVTSVLLSRYEVRLPKTPIEVSLGSVIAIWSVFWLGVSGAVLLGGAASFARLLRDEKVSANRLYKAFSGTVSIAIAAILFGELSRVEIASIFNWTNTGDTLMLAVAAASMALVSYFFFSLFDLVFKWAEGTVGSRSGRTHLYRFAETVLIATLSWLLCFAIETFGLQFGLVLVPAAVVAVFGYRFHLQRLESKTAQILEASRVYLATVEALATAIDARDQIGNGHVRRTELYAVGIGEALGLPPDEISALRTGALLHGIGKLAIPDHILSKPGKLTSAELEKTKVHALVAASILERIGFHYPVVPTVRHHNEFWDGTGYPEGLAGNSIPLTARILAVADAYDTLRCTRPFRQAVSREAARQHLVELSGIQFDPNIVNVFLKKMSGFEAEIASLGLHYVDDQVGVESRSVGPADNYVEQIKLANREVFTLYKMAREFGSSTDIKETLALFTHRIKELVPFDTCSVYLLDGTKRFADAVAVDGINSDLLASRRIRIGEGATGVALKKQQVVKNVNPDLDFSVSQLELTQQYSTMIAVPLVADGELIGAVSVYSITMSRYADEHVRLLDTISKIAADAIGKSQRHAEAQANALTDPLTSFPNARSLQLQFEKEAARATRADTSFQLIVMDLDGFKAVNDTFGHKVGDQMLCEVGKVIQQQLRDYDFFARYGGDEFVALIPDAAYADVADLCSRIEGAVNDFRLPIDEHIVATVGVSLGFAGYPQSGSTFDQMLVAADRVMYSSKLSRKRASANGKSVLDRPVAEMVDAETGLYSANIAASGRPSNESFIVELDESHVVASEAIN